MVSVSSTNLSTALKESTDSLNSSGHLIVSAYVTDVIIRDLSLDTALIPVCSQLQVTCFISALSSTLNTNSHTKWLASNFEVQLQQRLPSECAQFRCSECPSWGRTKEKKITISSNEPHRITTSLRIKPFLSQQANPTNNFNFLCAWAAS